MDNEVYERLARLETISAAQTKDMEEIKESVGTVISKVDQILSYASWGKGAIWGIIKFGSFLAGIAAAFAWLYDRFFGLGPHP